LPDPKMVEKMMKYNESLQRRACCSALDGLHPPAMGARVSFLAANRRSRTALRRGEGSPRRLLMIQVKSKAEALEWASRAPMSDNEIIEVRQVQEFNDFPPETQKSMEGFQEMQNAPRK